MEQRKTTDLLQSELDRRLVALYRAWDVLEQTHSGKPIIDFDLAPKRDFEQIRSRQDVLRELEAMRDTLEDDSSPVHDLVRRRLTASITYLRVLLGEVLDFRSYIRSTLALNPRFFSEEEISERKEIAVNRLKKSFGLTFQRDEFKRFQSVFRIKDDLPQQFDVFRSIWVPQLLRHVEARLNDYRISVEFASEDAYWKSWISGDLSEHLIRLQINVHPRHFWYQGSVESLVIHEYCAHAVQMVSWHERIEEKQLPEFLGILTVHFPDQFLLEGLAESLIYFLPSEDCKLEPMSVVLRDLHYYVLSVMNNLHILANEESPGAALKYALERLPFTSEDVIEREIRDRTTNPLFRCYQYVYAIAKESFLNALNPLDQDQRWELLRLVYNCPMTAKQFEEISGGLPA